MLDFLTTTEGAWGDGSVKLTTIGIAIVIIVILALFIVSTIIRQHNAEKKAALTTKQLVFSAVAIALAIVCSMIKFANLPMGGSVTLMSMLFVVLIAYWYGPTVGLMTAIAYGLLQFVMEPIFYTIPQMLIDYPLAFGALGLAGFFSKKKYGLQISALSSHGNMVHPDPAIAAKFNEDFTNAILLAEKLGVPVVNTFSGCPGGAPGDKTPNWVTCPWPDAFISILDYQWNEVLIPYWKEKVAFARAHGVHKIALELHPGFCVYNTKTLLRLREAVGPEIGAN